VDDFAWDKVKFYLVYVLSFAVGTFANMKVLAMANVETVIVFRSCTPLAVSFFDYIFHNRAAPSARSCFALLLIFAGAMMYIATDKEFQVKGVSAYYWVMLWWAVLIFQLTYGKFLVTGIPIVSLWTPVLFTNTLAIAPAFCMAYISGELERWEHVHYRHAHQLHLTMFWVGLSCAIGAAISWAGFWCQSLVSATTYTVVGVMNKMLTVTLNVLIWDNHASTYGLLSLLVCLAGGTLYQQSPLRSTDLQKHQGLPMVDDDADEHDDDHEEEAA